MGRGRPRAHRLVGTDPATSLAAFELAAGCKGVHPSAGIHPHDASTSTDHARDAIAELCRRPEKHGFTVHARPADANGPLTIQLSVRGGLEPVVSKDELDVSFVNAGGDEVVTYAGLSVQDAEGRMISSGWTNLPGQLVLSADDRTARYPLYHRSGGSAGPSRGIECRH